MFAGDIYAPQTIRLVDVPEPKLQEPGEIIFEPELTCLCGSDLLYFDGDYPEYQPRVGQSLHEMIGRVVETSGSRFQPGDQVLCVPDEHFGFYQRFRSPESRAIPVDPRPPREHALMAQPLGTVLCALKKIPCLLDLNVAVVGQGPMGQLFCSALRNVGARKIIAIDKLQYRLEASRRMGATDTVLSTEVDPIEAVREMTGGHLADLVVEVVGHRDQALNLCGDLCRAGGSILFFGVPTERIDGIRWRNLFLKNITIYNSVGPSFEHDFPLAMQWIAEGRLDVTPLLTHRFAVDRIQEAFDLFHNRRDGALKVLVDFVESA